jgi:hypothetical protein
LDLGTKVPGTFLLTFFAEVGGLRRGEQRVAAVPLSIFFTIDSTDDTEESDFAIL